MFTVVIAEKEGAERRVTFTEAEVTVGRVPGNDVVLPKGNVSKRHSRIVLKDNRFIVVDLKSTNGTFVNGRKITSPLVVKEGDKIYVGDYVLTLEGAPALDALEPPSLIAVPTLSEGQLRAPDNSQRGPGADAGTRAPAGQGGRNGHLAGTHHDGDDDLPAVLRGAGTLSHSSIPASAEPSSELQPDALLSEHDEDHLLPAESELEVFEDRSSGEQAREPGSDVHHAARAYAPAMRGGAQPAPEPVSLEEVLGPLHEVLEDDAVFHVVVERFDRIRADRGQGLTRTGASFASPQALLGTAEDIQALAGLPLGTASFDVALPNGLSVVGLMPAAASNGTLLSIRRRPTHIDSLAEQAEQGVVSFALATKLEGALLAKRHVWLVGPSGLDTSALFASMLAACPEQERLALFERAPEVAVGERSTLGIKLGGVPLTELLERVRAFRPDRLAFYGLREDELPQVLETLAHRHEGYLASLEARSAKDALAAFDRAVGPDLTLRAVSLLVELKREPSGRVSVAAAHDIELDASGALAFKTS
jgi:pilus assembly protein CpaF